MSAIVTPATTQLPTARLLRAYLMESRMALVAALRAPDFAIPFLAVPMAIYLLFGVVITGGTAAANGPYGAGLANYLFSGLCALAVMMPGIFGGVNLAAERQGRLLTLKRALPTPPGAVIVSKLIMPVGVGALAGALVAVLAIHFGSLTISVGQVVVIWLTLVVGSLAFAALGLLVGSLASAAAAPAWGLVVFLPQVWLSGSLIPLPEWLERWVIIWPMFHLNQLALGAAGVDQFRFIPTSMAAAVLLGIGVICGGIAVRRLARVG
jgi:ABC-2 type transport system permease protein